MIITMTATRGTLFGDVRSPSARPVRQSRPAIPAGLRQAAAMSAGVAIRFGLALLPVSALAGMFAWL